MESNKIIEVSVWDYVMILAAVVMWGGSFAATKYAVATASPEMIIWTRLLFSLPVLIVVEGFQKELRLPTKEEFLILFGLGIQGILFHQSIQSYAMRTAGASNANWLLMLAPAFVAVVGKVFLKESITKRAAIGYLIALFGVGLVVLFGTYSATGADLSFGSIGDYIILLSVFNLSIYYTLTKLVMEKRRSSMTCGFVTFWEMLFSFVVCTFLIPIMGESFSEVCNYGVDTWLAIVFLGVMSSALAYLFWFRGFEVLPANKVVIFQFLQPIAGSVFAYFLVGERFTWWFFVGAGLVVYGIWNVNQRA